MQKGFHKTTSLAFAEELEAYCVNSNSKKVCFFEFKAFVLEKFLHGAKNAQNF